MTAVGLGESGSSSRRGSSAGVQLGEYVLGQPLWPLRIADAYRANGPQGRRDRLRDPRARSPQNPHVRDQIIAGTRAAAALPEHKHLVRTLAAGLTGDILWIATEEVDGSLVRDMLIKKRQAGSAGFGARGTGNLITGVPRARRASTHGALASESVVVSRTGRVRVIDLALGPGTIAAMRRRARSRAELGRPRGRRPARRRAAPADVYAVGALLYEALVGTPLERGGPRPSDVVPGVEHADRRDRRARVPPRSREAVRPRRRARRGRRRGARQGRRDADRRRVPTLVDRARADAGRRPESPSARGRSSPPRPHDRRPSGNAVVDRALAAALADTDREVADQPRAGSTTARSRSPTSSRRSTRARSSPATSSWTRTPARAATSATHPLLGPMVEAARAAARRSAPRAGRGQGPEPREEARRAALRGDRARRDRRRRRACTSSSTRCAATTTAKKVAGVIDARRRVAQGQGVDAEDAAARSTTRRRRPSHRRRRRRRRRQNASENLALDMSDDTRRDRDARHGHGLRACTRATARSSAAACSRAARSRANIGIIIDGPSGRVNFVKVNGKQPAGCTAASAACCARMQFPTIHGPRTRAEFDIAHVSDA